MPEKTEEPDESLQWKAALLLIYIVIAIGFTFWNWLFSAERFRGFAYNFGRACVWPLQVIPGLGELLAGVVIVALIIGVMAGSGNRD